MNAGLSVSSSGTKWGDLVMGALPFVVFGTAVVLFEAPLEPGPAAGVTMITAGVLILGGYVLILAVLLWAWLKEFPRWSMPYLGYGLIFALYLSAVSTPGLVILHTPIWGRDAWGLRACVPGGLVVILGLLFSRPPWKPLIRLFENIWKDWTFLAFGMYGFLPLLLPILQDEVDSAYTLWPTLIAVWIMVAGAALYLVYARKPFRSAFLLGGMFLAVLAVSIGANFYWKTHSLNLVTSERILLSGPAPWQAILTDSILAAVIWTLILAVSGLVGVLHNLVKKLSVSPPSL